MCEEVQGEAAETQTGAPVRGSLISDQWIAEEEEGR